MWVGTCSFVISNHCFLSGLWGLFQMPVLLMWEDIFLLPNPQLLLSFQMKWCLRSPKAHLWALTPGHLLRWASPWEGSLHTPPPVNSNGRVTLERSPILSKLCYFVTPNRSTSQLLWSYHLRQSKSERKILPKKEWQSHANINEWKHKPPVSHVKHSGLWLRTSINHNTLLYWE